ncbi:MAG: TIGR02281 family clan AA aspartic protease [Rhizobiaceae bacterium]|nr:TIGR02281 family clan AA aspartic protease [Rhizobiaceae bacterium]
MFKNLILIGILVGASASLPVFLELNPDAVERWYRAVVNSPGNEGPSPARPAEPTIMVTKMAPPEAAAPLLGRKVLVRSDPRGHFIAEFRLNGRPIEAMIDTGATVIAINRSTARRIGVSVSNADFKYDVRTANGTVKAAVGTIGRVQIGRIAVDEVQAMVMDDKALDGVLVGMSFLKRLSKFQVENGALLLQQ